MFSIFLSTFAILSYSFDIILSLYQAHLFIATHYTTNCNRAMFTKNDFFVCKLDVKTPS